MSLVSSPCRNDARSGPDTASRPRSRSRNAAPSRAFRYASSETLETMMLCWSMRSLSIHFIRAGVVFAAVGAAGLARAREPSLPPTQLPSAESFTVFIKAVPVGTEQISVTRGASGWTIVSSGRMGAPIDISARRVQVRYTEDWKPIELTVDATVRGQLLSIQTVVT